MNRKIKRLLYFAAIVVLFILGYYLWKEPPRGEITSTVFTVDGVREAVFDFYSEANSPETMYIRFEGKLDCDGLIVIKEKNADKSVLFRKTFPVTKENVKKLEVKCEWRSQDAIIEFKTSDCVTNNFKIFVELEESSR